MFVRSGVLLDMFCACGSVCATHKLTYTHTHTRVCRLPPPFSSLPSLPPLPPSLPSPLSCSITISRQDLLDGKHFARCCVHGLRHDAKRPVPKLVAPAARISLLDSTRTHRRRQAQRASGVRRARLRGYQRIRRSPVSSYPHAGSGRTRGGGDWTAHFIHLRTCSVESSMLRCSSRSRATSSANSRTSLRV